MKQKKKAPYLHFSDNDLEAIYDSGKNATISFMRMLIDKINQLEVRIEKLEDEKSKDSHNSNKPPSSDNHNKKPKSLRKKTGRKPGGQKNHKGYTLKKVEKPDKVEKIPSVKKCDCGKSLKFAKIIEIIKRQLFDIIISPLVVTEYQGEVKLCDCGKYHFPAFPDHVNKAVQYGPVIKSIGSYLKYYGFLSYDRLSEFFKDVFDVTISQGTLVNFINECAEKVSPVVNEIKEELIVSDVCNFDETGFRIEGNRYWLHSVGNERFTYYAPHTSRGHDAMEDIGILPFFKGTAIHDYWKAYYFFTNCDHGLCNQHHLRELVFFEEKGEKWASKIRIFLLDLKKKIEKCKRFSTEEIKKAKRKFRRLISEGIKLHPEKIRKNKTRGRPPQSKEHNLLKRFKERIDEVLRFILNPDVPFGNNRAEQDVRMTKIQQKVSGSFRSMKGAKNFCIIRSYISSIRKNGLSVFKALKTVWSDEILNPIF